MQSFRLLWTKNKCKKRENETSDVMNANVVTKDLMGNRGVEGHVVERRPFVWPANFSLLAKGLRSQGREKSIVAWRSGASKTMRPSSSARPAV